MVHKRPNVTTQVDTRAGWRHCVAGIHHATQQHVQHNCYGFKVLTPRLRVCALHRQGSYVRVTPRKRSHTECAMNWPSMKPLKKKKMYLNGESYTLRPMTHSISS